MLSFENLDIISPKQTRSSRTGWDAFFPYYAGYPASFAARLIDSARLPSESVVFDPWNGSGTTTQAASKLGLRAVGCDINPVMVVVSRARCLLPTDGDSICPIAAKVAAYAAQIRQNVPDEDPLLDWFDLSSAEEIRSLEFSVREHLLGSWTRRLDGTHFGSMSSLAATFYVALFLTCRSFVSAFQSSNPTWLRKRRTEESRITIERGGIVAAFQNRLATMESKLSTGPSEPSLGLRDRGPIDIFLADSTELGMDEASVDFVLTSPPYCTRIDYTAATRIELAVIAPLLSASPKDLSRKMIGTTRVPTSEIAPNPKWGKTCIDFLNSVKSHSSKASSGYYLKTHLDYFNKMERSIKQMARVMKDDAKSVVVVQDSHYKEIHNDLPLIVSEMSRNSGLSLLGLKEFRLSRSMSGVNPYTRVYGRRTGAVETVLCFRKS